MKSHNHYLLAFVKQMDFELKANEHKGDWRKFENIEEIHKELDHHLDKLYRVEELLRDPNTIERDHLPGLIKEYIADSANILMMLGKAYKLYEKD